MMMSKVSILENTVSSSKMNHRNHCPRNLGMFQKVVIKKQHFSPIDFMNRCQFAFYLNQRKKSMTLSCGYERKKHG